MLENTMNIPDLEKGGPIFFKVMMENINLNTEEVIHALTAKSFTLTVTLKQGENIKNR